MINDKIAMSTISKTEEKQPWLTIIIPVFNAEKYLSKCLKSILYQSYRDFEVILVDDGSTDNSLSIANNFSESDERIRVFRIDNSGSLYARCYGARLARGEYITFCDADDYYVKNAFCKLKKICADETYDCVQFGYYRKYNHIFIRKKNTKRLISNHDEFKYRDYPILLCSFYEHSKLTHTVWNKIYHRRLLNNLPTKIERVFWGDDIIINLHLLKDCQIALYINEPLYVYQASTGGTTRFNKNVMCDLNLIKQHQLFFLNQWDGKDKGQVLHTLYSEISGWFYSHVKECMHHISMEETRQIIKEAFALPIFIKAREYFETLEKELSKSDALLRNSDIEAYIDEAIHDRHGKQLMHKWIQLAKSFFKHI